LNRIFQIVDLPSNGLKALVSSLDYVRRSKLWLQVLIAMVLGILVGIALNPDMNLVSHSSALTIGEWISLPGKLFLALIQMIVVPLIFSSIVQGICSSTSLDQLKSTGLWALLFFVTTTIVAVIVGISTGTLLQPGKYIDSSQIKISSEEKKALKLFDEDLLTESTTALSLKDLPNKFTGLFPENPMSSIVKGDMMQIVIFALIMGIGLLTLSSESARPLKDLFGSIQNVSMAIVGIAMGFSPLAVFGLLAQSMIQTGPQALVGLGMYTLAVIFAMIALYFFYVIIVSLIGGQGPMEFIKASREPLLLGFSTNSSAATMPVTITAAEDDLNIPSHLSQFIVPLGATINMAGTASYQALTTLFMAQLFGLELSLSALTALTVTAVGASIGTPAVPGVGIVVLAGVLSSAGVPLAGLPLILGIDRILERLRTSINVTGDLAACCVLNHFLQKSSESMTIKETTQ
jgi:Na+/H+-dicarboxylate symporter